MGPKIRLGIGGRIMLACSAVIVVCLGTFGFYLDRQTEADLDAALQAEVDQNSQLAAQVITSWVDARLGLVENLRDDIAGMTDPAEMMPLLRRKGLRETFLYNYLATEKGEMIIAPEGGITEDYDPRVRPWYIEIRESGGSAVTEPYVEVVQDRLLVTMGTTLVENGKLRGVVGGDVTLQAVVDMVTRLDLGGKGYAFLINEDGEILIHPDGSLTMKPLREVYPNLTVDPQSPEARLLHDGGEGHLTAFVPIEGLPGVRWTLGFAVDKEIAYAPLAEFHVTMAIQIVLVVVIIIGLIGYLLRRLVLRPVRSMTGVMSHLAEGDLQVDVPYGTRRDEMGRMAQAVDHFKNELLRIRQLEQEKLEDMVRSEQHRKAALSKLVHNLETTVGEVVEEVTRSAGSMSDASTRMAALASQTSERATVVSGASQEASANVQTVASATEELSSSIHDIGQQVSQTNTIAQEARQEIADTTDAVTELAEEVGRIGEVVSLITDIASQTNLLALNATIEAARAGDAGKGFAVVANEVKTLANQTARATEQIATNIASVQGGTDRAVKAIQSIGQVIGRMSEIAMAVSAAVEEQNAATAEIARSVDQTARGTQDVSESIADVEQAASETGESAQHIAEASRGLSVQATRLSDGVTRFIAQVRADKEDIHLLEWSEDLRLGVPAIDDHHREIITAMNRFVGEMLHGEGGEAASTMLDKMSQDMARHFREEEDEMTGIGYPDLAEHRKQHKEFLDRMEQSRAGIEARDVEEINRFFDYTADWLHHHIQKSDRAFVTFSRQSQGFAKSA